MEKEPSDPQNLEEKNFMYGEESSNDRRIYGKEQESEEKEAEKDAGETGRKKIFIPPGMASEEIQKKFNVSRTTAWRAKTRGWLFFNYHVRVIDYDREYGQNHEKELAKSAKIGAAIALRKFGMDKRSIRPYEFSDLVSVAFIRLMELTGHPQIENEFWRNAVAGNAAKDFIQSQIISAGKVFKDADGAEDEGSSRLLRELMG